MGERKSLLINSAFNIRARTVLEVCSCDTLNIL